MTAEFPLAVHALVYLLHKGKPVSSDELARNICTNPARVRKVMGKLCHAGLAVPGRGKGSGYSGNGDASLSLDRVLAALSEEPLNIGWHSGDIDMECLVASNMGEIMDGIYSELNSECMRRLSQITIGSINNRIFTV